MKARYLDSRDVLSLSDALASAARKSRELDLAAAFLTTAGADQVLRLVRLLIGAKRSQRVRVLVGTWLGVTEPTALRRLQRAKGVTLRIAKTPGFHVKHLSFRGSTNVIAFTGSANFTAKGLGGEGELVVEVTAKLKSPSATGEADAFRRLWADAYPDHLTAKVIDAYAKGWKRPRFIADKGSKPGKSLLKQFGKVAAKSSSLRPDDGSVLWFPLDGSLADSTIEALEAEIGSTRKEFVGLGGRGPFDRVKRGAGGIWLLDLRGGPKDRSLLFHRILDWVEMATEDDGRYFAVLSSVVQRISLRKRGNREGLKRLGLVERIDSLASSWRTLKRGRHGVAAKLLALAAPTAGRRRRETIRRQGRT